jgi:hypothetical protein
LVGVFREAYAEVEAELVGEDADVGRTHFEVIDALNAEAAVEEIRLSAAHLAMMSWGHCHEAGAWEEYHGEEEAGEECREVVEEVVLQHLMTRNPNSILLDHHGQNPQDHCFPEH